MGLISFIIFSILAYVMWLSYNRKQESPADRINRMERKLAKMKVRFKERMEYLNRPDVGWDLYAPPEGMILKKHGDLIRHTEHKWTKKIAALTDKIEEEMRKKTEQMKSETSCMRKTTAQINRETQQMRRKNEQMRLENDRFDRNSNRNLFLCSLPENPTPEDFENDPNFWLAELDTFGEGDGNKAEEIKKNRILIEKRKAELIQSAPFQDSAKPRTASHDNIFLWRDEAGHLLMTTQGVELVGKSFCKSLGEHAVDQELTATASQQARHNTTIQNNSTGIGSGILPAVIMGAAVSNLNSSESDDPQDEDQSDSHDDHDCDAFDGGGDCGGDGDFD